MTVADRKQGVADYVSKIIRAFFECDDEVQGIVRQMAAIVQSPDSDDQEKSMATETLVDALFPKLGVDGRFGFDIDEHLANEIEAELDTQEATFAERVKNLMAKKRLTQEALAEATGVNQSAIAMMLTRQCRPQKRTIEKIAGALGVPESVLWP